MKRMTSILLILVMAWGLLTGCGTDVPEEEAFAGTFEEGQDETPSTTPEKEEEPQKPTEQPKDEPSKEEEKPVEQPEENTVTTPQEEELANLYQSSVASICIATRDEKMDGMRGWPRRIADTYGMNAVNNGKSGVSVSNKRKQGTVLTQLLEKKTEQYDYVVLHGGVNDAWSLVDVGIMTDGFDPKTFDPATFGGGLELLIYNAILHYGDNASIGYLVNFKAPACQKGTVANMTEYNELAKQICDKWGITYFDMYNHEEITKQLKMDTLINTTDYIHPSSSGYDILTPFIADYMKTSMVPCKQEIMQTVLGK